MSQDRRKSQYTILLSWFAIKVLRMHLSNKVLKKWKGHVILYSHFALKVVDLNQHFPNMSTKQIENSDFISCPETSSMALALCFMLEINTILYCIINVIVITLLLLSNVFYKSFKITFKQFLFNQML